MTDQCDPLIAKNTMQTHYEAGHSRLDPQHRLAVRNARTTAKRVPLPPSLISIHLLERLPCPISKIHFEQLVGKLRLEAKLFRQRFRRLTTAFQRADDN